MLKTITVGYESFVVLSSPARKSTKSRSRSQSFMGESKAADGSSKQSRRLVPTRTEDRTINLNNLGASPGKSQKCSASIKKNPKKTERSPSGKIKVPKTRTKLEILKEPAEATNRISEADSKQYYKKTEEQKAAERIAKLKQDLYAPKIAFRELKDGEEPEQIAESKVLDAFNESSTPRKDQIDKRSQVRECLAEAEEFEYSRDSGLLAPGHESASALSYHEERGEDSAYLIDLINGKDDDLENIPDEKKREEIRDYRNKKRQAAEEELKLDGKLL